MNETTAATRRNSSLSARPGSTGEYANRVTQYEFVREFFTSNTISVLAMSLSAEAHTHSGPGWAKHHPKPGPTPTATPMPTVTPTPTPTPRPTPTPTSIGSLPNFSHAFVIVMENEESSSIVGNATAPYNQRQHYSLVTITVAGQIGIDRHRIISTPIAIPAPRARSFHFNPGVGAGYETSWLTQNRKTGDKIVPGGHRCSGISRASSTPQIITTNP